MGGMHHHKVIMLKKLEGMALVPYPIKNGVKRIINSYEVRTDLFVISLGCN